MPDVVDEKVNAIATICKDVCIIATMLCVLDCKEGGI